MLALNSMRTFALDMKKIFFYITILLTFCVTISAYATKTKATNVFDKAQLVALSHQTALHKSVVCPADIDILELIEEGSEETDDSEDENSSFSTPNIQNFYPVFARLSTFLSKKTPNNTHSFSRSLPIFIFIRVFRL